MVRHVRSIIGVLNYFSGIPIFMWDAGVTPRDKPGLLIFSYSLSILSLSLFLSLLFFLYIHKERWPLMLKLYHNWDLKKIYKTHKTCLILLGIFMVVKNTKGFLNDLVYDYSCFHLLSLFIILWGDKGHFYFLVYIIIWYWVSWFSIILSRFVLYNFYQININWKRYDYEPVNTHK